MGPSRKSRREKASPPEILTAWRLPADLLLQMVGRFDVRTFVRCAATCKLLRRRLLSPPSICRVSEAAPCILAYLCTDAKKPLTLVHPTTPATLTFCHNHLSRFLSRKAAGTLLGKYGPLSSRHGLVLLRSLNLKDKPKPECCLDLCVYDPMSGSQTIFPSPPEIRKDWSCEQKYVFLTAADGIDYSFLLLVFDIKGWNVRVHTVLPCGTWEVKNESDDDFPWCWLKKRGNPAILRGGVIHWIACLNKPILSYDVRTGKAGSVKLPPSNCDIKYDGNQLHLATSSDGELLKLLAIQGFMMFVWLQLPVSATCGSGWSLETVINMEEKLRFLDPDITGGPNERIEFEGSGKRSVDVVFLEVVCTRCHKDHRGPLIFFDLETKKMHRQKREFSLLEIDLSSRLETMKLFS